MAPDKIKEAVKLCLTGAPNCQKRESCPYGLSKFSCRTRLLIDLVGYINRLESRRKGNRS